MNVSMSRFQDETYELLPGSLEGSFEKATRIKIRISKCLILLILHILLIFSELLKIRTTVEDIKESYGHFFMMVHLTSKEIT